jgi:hypothetical protein
VEADFLAVADFVGLDFVVVLWIEDFFFVLEIGSPKTLQR